jgi:hypoxanthine phosphoribosyltransferase
VILLEDHLEPDGIGEAADKAAVRIGLPPGCGVIVLLRVRCHGSMSVLWVFSRAWTGFEIVHNSPVARKPVLSSLQSYGMIIAGRRNCPVGADSNSSRMDTVRPGAPARRPEPIPNPKRKDGEPLRFSHPAEAAFARVLDFYQIEWEYEPTTFPLEWDDTGRVTTAFSPDFYLVDEDLYIELTTMKQRLVTAKNRKLRRLHELYPDVQCKLMYRKDVSNLAIKFGLFEEEE